MIPPKENDPSSPISQEDLAYVRSRYQDRIARSGVTLESMNTGGEAKQRVRHTMHAELIGANDRVLDVGCGIGQFLEHLERGGFRGAYHGIDLIPEYIEHCAAKFPGARFELRDVFLKGIEDDYDVIVASQVFNARYKNSDNFEVLQKFLTLAFAHCRKSVSVDMISSYVDFTVPELYNFEPEKVFAFSKGLTKFVKIRHDYFPFEFSVQLFKAGTPI